MVSFGEKAKIKKAGNLNSGCSYVITTVTLASCQKISQSKGQRPRRLEKK